MYHEKKIGGNLYDIYRKNIGYSICMRAMRLIELFLMKLSMKNSESLVNY